MENTKNKHMKYTYTMKQIQKFLDNDDIIDKKSQPTNELFHNLNNAINVKQNKKSEQNSDEADKLSIHSTVSKHYKENLENLFEEKGYQIDGDLLKYFTENLPETFTWSIVLGMSVNLTSMHSEFDQNASRMITKLFREYIKSPDMEF